MGASRLLRTAYVGRESFQVGFGVPLAIDSVRFVPFVFDFGWPIAKDDDDDTRVFNFSMGASF